MNQLNLELKETFSKNKISFPEKEKIHLKLVSRKNTNAIDVMGLSWIFLEDESF